MSLLAPNLSKTMKRRMFRLLMTSSNNNNSTVFSSSATEIYRRNRPSPRSQIFEKSELNLTTHTERTKVYDDLSTVSFSKPATCTFREIIDTRNPHHNAVESDTRNDLNMSGMTGGIINLDNTGNERKKTVLHSVEGERQFADSRIFAVLGLGLFLIALSGMKDENKATENAAARSS